MRVDHREKNSILHGIAASLTRRRIQKYQRKLGNGHDAELHLTVADLYKHLGEHSLALESYQAAAASVSQNRKPRNIAGTNHLITIYKRILDVCPLDDETANKLGQEYLRRGLDYKAVSLHTLLAERYARQGEYRKATEQYQRVFAVEPGSISARTTCANLYRQLGEYERGAKEYMKIGDLYFEHQKSDNALEYYQQALELCPNDETIKHKLNITQQILKGTFIPQPQASLQLLPNMSQESSHLERSLAEKEHIEQELRNYIVLLKRRYQKSVALKNTQLQTTQKRLDELSTYVAVFKDNLENIVSEKQHLQEQLEAELAHKHTLEQKLARLCELDPQSSTMPATTQFEQAERLEVAITRLKHEKIRLEQHLQEKLEQSSRCEQQLRHDLEIQISNGSWIKRQLTLVIRERQQIGEKAQQQLQESLRREQMRQHQMKQLMRQHEQALNRVKHEKQMLEKKCQITQACMSVVERHNITTLEQLHGELSRQCQMEDSFSDKFQESLREITRLLHNQEQEIQKLEHV